MSLSGEEQNAAMSLSGEEQNAAMSLSGEEQSPAMSGAPKLSHPAAAGRVVAGLILTGAAGGVLWAWLAPPVHTVVALSKKGQRVHGYFGDEADRVFLGAALAVGFLSVIAVVATVLVWQWRAHRGPLMALALTIGGIGAAGALTGVGAALAHWRYGTVDINAVPVTPEQRVAYVVEAPPILFGHSPVLVAVTLMFPVGLAALLYAMCALATRRDDLDAWPPVEAAFPVAVSPGIDAVDAGVGSAEQ